MPHKSIMPLAVQRHITVHQVLIIVDGCVACSTTDDLSLSRSNCIATARRSMAGISADAHQRLCDIFLRLLHTGSRAGARCAVDAQQTEALLADLRAAARLVPELHPDFLLQLQQTLEKPARSQAELAACGLLSVLIGDQMKEHGSIKQQVRRGHSPWPN